MSSVFMKPIFVIKNQVEVVVPDPSLCVCCSRYNCKINRYYIVKKDSHKGAACDLVSNFFFKRFNKAENIGTFVCLHCYRMLKKINKTREKVAILTNNLLKTSQPLKSVSENSVQTCKLQHDNKTLTYTTADADTNHISDRKNVKLTTSYDVNQPASTLGTDNMKKADETLNHQTGAACSRTVSDQHVSGPGSPAVNQVDFGISPMLLCDSVCPIRIDATPSSVQYILSTMNEKSKTCTIEKSNHQYTPMSDHIYSKKQTTPSQSTSQPPQSYRITQPGLSSQLYGFENTHSAGNEIGCGVCGREFMFEDELEIHVIIHERKHFDNSNWQECYICGDMFKYQFQLTNHLSIHSLEKNYKCISCGKIFISQPSLTRHKKFHCDIQKEYKCDVCGKTFSWKYGLTAHMKRHSGGKWFTCPTCGKSFMHDGEKRLERHMKIHSGEKPWKCDVCGKSYKLSTTLSYHRKIHSGEKPYVCDVCGKRFIWNTNLRTHMSSHSDEKPFTCGFCGRTFKTRSTLYNHTKLHTGNKTFNCTICDQVFIQRRILERHTRHYHFVNRPYKCSWCKQAFYDKGTLKQHSKIHMCETFTCEICYKAFTQALYLRRHLKRHDKQLKQFV